MVHNTDGRQVNHTPEHNEYDWSWLQVIEPGKLGSSSMSNKQLLTASIHSICDRRNQMTSSDTINHHTGFLPTRIKDTLHIVVSNPGIKSLAYNLPSRGRCMLSPSSTSCITPSFGRCIPPFGLVHLRDVTVPSMRRGRTELRQVPIEGVNRSSLEESGKDKSRGSPLCRDR